MKILIPLLVAVLLVTIPLVPSALAQDDTNESTHGGGKPFWVPPGSETTMVEGHTLIERTTAGGEDLVDSGGPSVLLPAATLLLSSGILGYAIVMRRG